MLITAGARMLARLTKKRFRGWELQAESLQMKTMKHLVLRARYTAYGKEHGFGSVKTYPDFVNSVPVRSYESFKPYIDRIISGEKNVLWPGKPLYFAKTSGTTSGIKYIPITKASIPNHIDSARNALLMYLLKTDNDAFLKGKYIFISGSPELQKTGGILTGRLSGIVHHHVPAYLNRKKCPTYATNIIDDWEKKLEGIIDETMAENMSLISGIPPWVEMYFESLLKRTGKKQVQDIFPEFSLFVHGGVNFSLYSDKIFGLIGREIDCLETYPASEGFIAFQDEFPSRGLLLIPDSGIFFEFIPAERFHEADPPRYWLGEVETGRDYALILSSNAGLWGYSIGDTVRFVSTKPYRIVVTGRLSHFTSAFGEHVIASEAEYAMKMAAFESGAVVREFTLAPLVNNPNGLPCHQWFVEFKQRPSHPEAFAEQLDKALQEKNIYYKDLIKGKILQKAMVVEVPSGTFNRYLDAFGKLGGQNKLPHLSNDRTIADWIAENQPGTGIFNP